MSLEKVWMVDLLKGFRISTESPAAVTPRDSVFEVMVLLTLMPEGSLVWRDDVV